MSAGPPATTGSSPVRDAVWHGQKALNSPPAHAPQREDARTSDLSIDEVLLLHSIGWEPLELVCGVSIGSVYAYTWKWSVGEIVDASKAYALAFATAAERIAGESREVGGHGVIGVKVELEIHPHRIDVTLVGTSVRPVQHGRDHPHHFVSDLSTRDFCLLHQAGWEPLGLAYGASFVHAPRRSAGSVLSQQTQNVELTNFTAALYDARETAMDRMQSHAIGLSASGVVDVAIQEGPLAFANHTVVFAAWGTAVRAGPDGHHYLEPRVVLPLDDARVTFDARSLG